MDRRSYNASDKNIGSKKPERSARSRHVGFLLPDNTIPLGEGQAEKNETAKPAESQKREALPNRDISSQREKIANHGHFIHEMQYNVTPEEYDQHKQKIHENIKKAENYHKILNGIDQRLEKRFKNLSWFKRILGRDSIKKIDKCEYELKQNKQKLKNALDDLENTIQGNPNNYACVSPTQFIKLDPKDENQFQRRIDRMKLREPQPGDKLTPRQKRFEEQEARRTQAVQEVQEVYRKEQNEKIDKIKKSVGIMLKDSKEYMNRAARSKDSVKLFRAAKLVSNRVSLWKEIEKRQYNQISNSPDLVDKCKIIREKLNAYHKELNETMTKKFGTQWTSRGIKSR